MISVLTNMCAPATPCASAAVALSKPAAKAAGATRRDIRNSKA